MDASADLIVLAARVHTVDDTVPYATACAVRDGRFICTGSAREALALRGPRTRVLDAGTGTVVPGFIDAHVHLLGLGHALREVNLTQTVSFEEAVERVNDVARASPEGWIVGSGWDHNRWPHRAFPSHDALSRAVPGRPVVLRRVDGHAVLANARAMMLAGITASTQEPSGGRIVRDGSGEPSGLFIDNAMPLVMHALPPPAHAQNIAAARAAQAECHRWGITSVAEAGVDEATLRAYDELAERGELTIRNHAMLRGADDELIAQRFARGPVTSAYDGRLSVRAVKMFADGALGSRGAALLAPYADDPCTTGLVVSEPETIEAVCARALDAGFQVCTHAIGDRANRMVLDAYERALRLHPEREHRFRIEHAQVLAAEDVPRFARLGVIASMQTSHRTSDAAWAEERLGSERMRGAYAWRALLDSGARIANGTDAPVEPVNPLRSFHAAVAGGSESGRMTREEAVRSMTTWAAYANFMEHEIGSIAPKRRADFTILDRDLMAVDPAEILEARILATYSGGEAVYEASA